MIRPTRHRSRRAPQRRSRLNAKDVGCPRLLAFYKLRFYELDQAISVGATDSFVFFVDPHFSRAPTSPPCPDMVLVFANTLLSASPTVAFRGTIASIFHPQLGAVQSIDTRGFDYRITLLTGEVVEVDAEEHAGTMHGAPSRVIDWSFLVDVQLEAPNKA